MCCTCRCWYSFKTPCCCNLLWFNRGWISDSRPYEGRRAENSSICLFGVSKFSTISPS
ncbi:hypothetical protein BHE74_00049748 [Ensete ventricosum]|uniref:Uncharacterized protein n=1 Tax=Ensete ventricosum TaxID=4639 RepID=A0A427AJC8_ENSVE|nr:hypothetical protein B296_00030258 [Ensete ventricosum]RWV89073.1 hypothetical protein GW17_00048803 [Ensete ventricosum]RWW44484.1 hypothetical protein BHE74_00049748 [Ensete ventricosum]RZS23328.1 hypothetical protein BHM03_00056235 [Ensete ventricosum]